MAKTRTINKKTKTTVPFSHRLILSQWFLAQFDCQSFVELGEPLRLERVPEGLDENNVHHYHHILCDHFVNTKMISDSELLEYDQNIVRHTQVLNESRRRFHQSPIVWKYFQYLALLATEIYLDRYFRDPESFRQEIENRIETYNTGKDKCDQVSGFSGSTDPADDLNKVAFWIATGGGKTLLMHVNILQYQFYLEKFGRSRELNRIILLTPNEGLSEQHLQEFQLSGLHAVPFRKDKTGGTTDLFTGKQIEVIDIHKLSDTMGVKTVAVDAFEGNNLVLVDEGHRGASSGESGAWIRYRNKLCSRGFSFEYSATFAQAVRNNPKLSGLYSRSILFDYSYRYFYEDGFGKDYQILNLDKETQEEQLDLYMTACLLSYFQQLYYYHREETAIRPFQIEKPLWIFVGSKVTATLATKDASDIVEILKFLDRFLADSKESIKQIDRILNKKGITDGKGNNIFEGTFTWLNSLGLTPTEIYRETQSLLFNAPKGGTLHVQNLKGVQGELALEVGVGNKPFGVINVGDDSKLLKLCESNKLEIGHSDFGESLFYEINKANSTINILIGSKKFTEGWNSWRVSTMGLMNVGSSEGAQIIQLFGRGIRLKGYQQSLKRTTAFTVPISCPQYMEQVETLSIFGIHADYMAQFRDFLKEEGVSTDRKIAFYLPVVKLSGRKPLKTLRLKKKIRDVVSDFGKAFKKYAPSCDLGLPNDYLRKNQVILNWYPKVQAMRSKGDSGGSDVLPNQTHFSELAVSLLDTQKLYFELERFKAERGWSNLNLSRSMIGILLEDQSWYTLLIPEEELTFNSFDKIRLWQEIALALLKKYTERFYTYHRRQWEMPYLEYAELEDTDPNLQLDTETGESCYKLLIERSQEEIIAKLTELKAAIKKGVLKDWEFSGLKAIMFGKHLYQPLLHYAKQSQKSLVEISPVELNEGEKAFVEDLRKYCEQNTEFFKTREIYLLRNLSKGKGIGFFEAGNFYPDFIMWLLVDGKQYITFIDPKGISNLGINDPKIQFYQTIKDLEARLDDPNVKLNSFLVSNTPSHVMSYRWGGVKKDEMLEKHIVFQDEDKETYIGEILKMLDSSLSVEGREQ